MLKEVIFISDAGIGKQEIIHLKPQNNARGLQVYESLYVLENQLKNWCLCPQEIRMEVKLHCSSSDFSAIVKNINNNMQVNPAPVAFSKLKDKCQVMIILSGIGYSQVEIADLMYVTTEAVKKCRQRLYVTLRIKSSVTAFTYYMFRNRLMQ